MHSQTVAVIILAIITNNMSISFFYLWIIFAFPHRSPDQIRGLYSRDSVVFPLKCATSSWGSPVVKQMKITSCFFTVPLWEHGLSHLDERVTLHSWPCNYIYPQRLKGLGLWNIKISLPTRGAFSRWDLPQVWIFLGYPHKELSKTTYGCDWLTATVFTAVEFYFYDPTWQQACPSSIFKKSPNVRPSNALEQSL